MKRGGLQAKASGARFTGRTAGEATVQACRGQHGCHDGHCAAPDGGPAAGDLKNGDLLPRWQAAAGGALSASPRVGPGASGIAIVVGGAPLCLRLRCRRGAMAAAVDFVALAEDLPLQADRDVLLDAVAELHSRRCVHAAVPCAAVSSPLWLTSLLPGPLRSPSPRRDHALAFLVAVEAKREAREAEEDSPQGLAGWSVFPVSQSTPLPPSPRVTPLSLVPAGMCINTSRTCGSDTRWRRGRLRKRGGRGCVRR